MSPLARATLFGMTWGAAVGGPIAVAAVAARNVAVPSPTEALVAAGYGLFVGVVGGLLTGALFGLLVRVVRPLPLWPVGVVSAAGTASVVLDATGMSLAETALAFAAGGAAFLVLVLALRGLYHALRASRLLRGVALAWLALCVIGEGYAWLRPSEPIAPLPPRPSEPVVQLWRAPLPAGLGVIARHHWFAAWGPADGRWRRWEVWQYRDVGGTSWGHLHRDLMLPNDDVGAGGARVVREWRGRDAEALLAVLNESPRYAWCDRYASLPGPNSSTYIRWVLRQANVSEALEPLALGKDYLGPLGWDVTTTGSGLQLETPLVGVAAGLLDGVEIHFLFLTFGLDFWPPGVKTPLGRFGFPR